MGTLVGLRICKTRIPRTSELMSSFREITRVCPGRCRLFPTFYFRFILFPSSWFFYVCIPIHFLDVIIYCPCQILLLRLCTADHSTRISRDMSKVLSLQYRLFTCGWPPFGSYYIIERYIDLVVSMGHRVRVCVLLADMSIDTGLFQGK
jgi:hypothetical protein